MYGTGSSAFAATRQPPSRFNANPNNQNIAVASFLVQTQATSNIMTQQYSDNSDNHSIGPN